MECRVVGNRLRAGPGARLGRWFGLVVAAASTFALAAPSEAKAATGGYLAEFTVEPYRALPLDGGTPTIVNTSSGGDTPFAVTLPFPVNFYGTSYTSAHMSPDGWVSFTNSTSNYAAKAIPSSTAPNNMIAGWWRDQTCPANGMKSQTLGAAPNRTFVLEWNCHRLSTTTATVNYQVWFREGSKTVDVHYGTIVADDWKASLGIQKDATTGLAPLTCNTACEAPNFPTGKKLSYFLPPDLEVTHVEVEPVIYAGVSTTLEATVKNGGGKPAAASAVEVWLGSKAQPATGDELLERIDLQEMAADKLLDLSFTIDLPRRLEPGAYFLHVVADPDGVVTDDTNRGNNVGSAQVVLGPPTADLAVQAVEIPEDGLVVGSTQTIRWTLENLGNLKADEVNYQVVVSDNDIISSTDRVIGGGTVTIGELQSMVVDTHLQVPSDLRTGLFYLAIRIDAEGFLHELSKENNVGLTAEPVWITSTTGTILTSATLQAEAGSPFSIALEATGGDGFFEWNVESGTLPSGLSLRVMKDGAGRPQHTTLQGVPTAMGTHSFVVRARSAGWTDVKAIDLIVGQPGSMVVTISGTLPSGSFGIPYEGQLLAVGGAAPYTWSLAAGALPPGLALSSTGKLFGSPAKDGTFKFAVRVVDAAGREGTGDIEVNITAPGRLTCVTTRIAAGRVGEAIVPTAILSAGGVAPHQFSSEQTRRLSNGTSDSGEVFPNLPPPGLSLATDGTVTGTPTEAGRYVWMVKTVDARRNDAVCVVSFDVTYDQGPAILTTSLQDGYVDTPYLAQLRQFGADASARWEIAAGNKLPEGLSLSADGRISGMPSLAGLEGAEVRIFPFVVRVKDDANREAIQSLSIRVWRQAPATEAPKPPKSDEGGCQAGGGELSLLAFAGAAAHLLRRRK